jgi:Predicted Fe-S oxidoreductases
VNDLINKDINESAIRFYDKSEVLSGPLHIAVDVTNKCNAKCLHCFNRSGNELIRDELSDEQLLQVFEQIAEVKPFSICFCGGEPMYKYDILLKACRILHDAGILNIAMVSNGWLLTQEKVNELKKTGMKHIQISLDGCDATTHDHMRGVPGIFERATNAIEYIKKADLELGVAFSPTKFNIEQFPKVVEIVSGYAKMEVRIQPLMPMGKALTNEEELFPDDDSYRKVVEFVENHNNNRKPGDPHIEWGDPLDHLRRNLSYGYENSIFMEIKSDGTLSASAYLPLRVGNLKRHTIREYWNAGLGKVWKIPVVRELASYIMTIGDLKYESEDLPTVFFDDNIEIDLVDDGVMNHLEDFTLKKLYKE